MAGLGLGIVVTDTAGRIELFNEAATQILGSDLIGVKPEDWPMQFGLYLEDGVNRCPGAMSPLLRAINGEDVHNLEMKVVPTGKQTPGRWCVFNLRPLINENKQITGSILFIQDITERKKLADEVTRSNIALQQFASVAAHDLQEPLRSVSGFVDLLAKHLGNDLDEKSSHYMARIKDVVQRMKNLINDLLSYSRIQTKPQVLAVVDCNEVLEGCIQCLSASIRKSNAVVTIEPLPSLLADSSQLSQLFQNLLSNSLKFADPTRSTVFNVSARQDGLFWLFEVSDNSIGFDMQFSERVFGPFQKLHSHSAYEGTGMGLAICRGIVERHGGRIWSVSEPGKGTTFFFTLQH